MQAMLLVRSALELSDRLFQGLALGLQEHPLVTQAPSGGNHAIWTLGHITLIDAAVPGMISGTPSPLAKWESLFGMGSKPLSDASAYPGFDELLGLYRTHRAALLKLIEETGEAGLSRAPTHVPPGFEKEMATLGQTFQLIALHQMLHAGELADIRRVVGLKPLA